MVSKSIAEVFKQAISKHNDISITIYNMVAVLMSDEFREWMSDNWLEVSKLEEFEDIMSYYLHTMP